MSHTEAATQAKEEEEKKRDPCDTSELVDGIVDKMQLEEACKTFYNTPGSRGSDGPITRVYNGLDKRRITNSLPINLATNVKGAMFELQVALRLMQLKRGVKQFNLKCLKPNKEREYSNDQKFYEDDFFEYDVVTNDQSVIECKNVKSWPRAFDDASNKEVTKLKEQLSSGPMTVKNCRSKSAISNVERYKYEVHAANPIPEIWKDFMKQQGVAHIQDGYCPPDCGTIFN